MTFKIYTINFDKIPYFIISQQLFILNIDVLKYLCKFKLLQYLSFFRDKPSFQLSWKKAWNYITVGNLSKARYSTSSINYRSECNFWNPKSFSLFFVPGTTFRHKNPQKSRCDANNATAYNLKFSFLFSVSITSFSRLT